MMESRDKLFKWGVYALLLWFFCLMQTALPLRYGYVSAFPLIPLACVFSAFEKRIAGAVLSLCAGLLCDAFTVGTDGFFTLTLTIAAVLAAVLFQTYLKLNFITVSLWAAGVHAGIVFLYFFLFVFFQGRAGIEALYLVALPELLLTLPYYPLVYFLIKSICKRFS